jgi:sucrose-6-phosphate hydrolase SacC (GH32 family)
VKWVKQGQIFATDENFGWMNSHAQIPTALVVGDVIRVFFATRSKQTESMIACIDLDIKNPSKIINLYDKPVLNNGPVGTFDEHGLMPSGLVNRDGKFYLYYSGWSRRCTVPYNNLTGLAVSDDGINFKKVGRGPVLSQTVHEPFSATSPYVFFENGWHMFYCSGTDWILHDGKYEHVYDIKYASSKDGINWLQPGKAVIPSRTHEEAITRPVVLKRNNSYHMWFCYRGTKDFRGGQDSYRLGYAHSNDLVQWKRDDDKNIIDVSRDGWDCSMVSYPYVLETEFGTYMFYNGNGFGQTGFGYAKLEEV